MNQVIEKVQDFAGKAHAGQKRKYTPEPYIVHPVRVMQRIYFFYTCSLCSTVT